MQGPLPLPQGPAKSDADQQAEQQDIPPSAEPRCAATTGRQCLVQHVCIHHILLFRRASPAHISSQEPGVKPVAAERMVRTNYSANYKAQGNPSAVQPGALPANRLPGTGTARVVRPQASFHQADPSAPTELTISSRSAARLHYGALRRTLEVAGVRARAPGKCGCMIITLSRALPCGQWQDQEAGQASRSICGMPAVVGVISSVGDGVWELLPVCQDHLAEAAADWEGADPPSLGPAPASSTT